MNMKTWTNPTVEELEVEMTAAWLVAFTPEELGNGKIDWDGGQGVIGGGDNGGDNGGNNGGDIGGNNGGEPGGNGGEPGGDIMIGQGS